jgi:hypothetical protein
LSDAESKYHSHFSQSPLVSPKIEEVNAGSGCFEVLGRTNPFEPQIYAKIKVRDKIKTSKKSHEKVERFVYVTFFNENIFYTEKAAILKVYFRKSLISQLLLGIFQRKVVNRVILTSSIHFCQQIPRKSSKFIQKNS